MSRPPTATSLRLGLVALGLALTLVACPGPVPPGQSELEPQPPGPVVPAPDLDPEPAPTPDPDPVPDPPITSIAWGTSRSASMTRSEGQSGVVGGKLYVFGGFEGCGPTRSSEVFDPVAGTWDALPDLPTRLSHAGTAVVGNSVYLAGGYVATACDFGSQQFGTTDVWRYDVISRTYEPVTPLPVARGSGALVYANGKLHFFGGVYEVSPTDRPDAGEHWTLSQNGDGWAANWELAEPLPNPRSHMAYAGLNGKVYAIGGQKETDANLVTQATVEVYDPAADRWTALAPMPLARSHTSSATLVVGGRILVLGGEKAHTQGVDNITSYDPATNTWTELDPLPTARHSGVAAYIGANIYYSTGGTSATNKGVPSY